MCLKSCAVFGLVLSFFVRVGSGRGGKGAEGEAGRDHNV